MKYILDFLKKLFYFLKKVLYKGDIKMINDLFHGIQIVVVIILLTKIYDDLKEIKGQREDE